MLQLLWCLYRSQLVQIQIKYLKGQRTILGRSLLSRNTRASSHKRRVGHESIKLSLRSSGLVLEFRNLGLVVLSLGSELSLIACERDELLKGLHGCTLRLSLGGSVDGSASGHECGVGRQGRELGRGLRCLGLELGDLGGVVLGLVGELGLVGGELDDLVEGVHLFAERLVGDGLGGLVTALGNDSGGQNGGEEEAGELHVEGLRMCEGCLDGICFFC
jgi:hypothetical protein